MPDSLQHFVAARRDGQRAGPGVRRYRAALDVAALFERGHDPGQGGGGNAFGGGDIAKPQWASLLDGGQRRQLGGGQPGELMMPEPPGQPGDGDPQPGRIDLRGTAAHRASFPALGRG